MAFNQTKEGVGCRQASACPLPPESNLKPAILAGKGLQLGHTEMARALDFTCNFLAFPAQSNSDIIYK